MDRIIGEALDEIKRLKETMTGLEKKISQEGESSAHTGALKSESDKLNRLSDSLILKSKEAWQKYAELKRVCKAEEVEPPLLDGVRLRCSKIEQIAADLLCYSLGH